MRSTSILLALVSVATAFPGMSPGGLKQGRHYDASAGLERRAAEPYSPKYPYTGAKIDGKAGTGVGGTQVPAPGDEAHAYQPPPPGAHRGPCPGLNTAADHGFISRDGITTFDELVAAQQNVYNFDYGLAVAFATLGLAFDGDIDTEKLSIGGDATWLTSAHRYNSSADEPGLDGHSILETDSSLTRNDYYLANGDDYSFNGTLWQRMIDTAASTSGAQNPLLDVAAMTKYRAQRYEESLAENGRFYFGPRCILLYSAASLLYEVLPDSATGTVPSVANLAPIFGAVKAHAGPGNATGGWDHVSERLPPNWHNRRAPYSLQNITAETLKQYAAHPKLFGASHGVGHFQPDGSRLNPLGAKATLANVTCQIYESFLPGSVPGTANASEAVLKWAADKLNPLFAGVGCNLISP